MLYITLGDHPSGVYYSQVVDACKFWNQNLQANVRLVAFFSIKGYFSNRKALKEQMPNAIVLPAIPTMLNWRFNFILFFFLCLFNKNKIAICRGVLATKMAIWAKRFKLLKKVCYDGRGAVAAEWREYLDHSHSHSSTNVIELLEKDAVLDSNYQLAVSNKLIEYWQEKYNYQSTNNFVIPCTLNQSLPQKNFNKEELENARKELGFSKEDLILVYAGSIAMWQSFNLMKDFLIPKLKENLNLKVLFLAFSNENSIKLKSQFPEQVQIKWFEHHQVQKYLSACDYGILIREQSTTNKVAAPTKFAEYLAAGLPVLISKNLGDYTEFVQEKKCGLVIQELNQKIDLKPLNEENRALNKQLASKYFSKNSSQIKEKYQKLLAELNA